MLFTFDGNGKRHRHDPQCRLPITSPWINLPDLLRLHGATKRNSQRGVWRNFHTLCQNQRRRCQSPRDLTRYYRHEPEFLARRWCHELARRLTKACCEAFPQWNGKKSTTPSFRIAASASPCPCADHFSGITAPPRTNCAIAGQAAGKYEAFLDFCKETHANEAIPNRPGPYDSKLHHFVLIQNEKAVIKRYETQDANPNFEFDMQTLRLGDSAMVNCPFELYLVFGQIIKARSAARQTFVIQLSGGAGSYLPSPEAEKLGGYGGLIINGKVGSDGGYKLTDEAIDAIAKLF